MSSDFVHLRVHSEYSLKDSTIRIFDKERDNLIAACQQSNQTAVALTDEANLFAAVTFYKNAIQKNIKPIIGAELWVKIENRLVLMPFFAINKSGYRQLCTLISSAWLNPKEKDLPVINFSQLAQNCSDLIVLCGGLEGLIASLAIKEDKKLEQEIKRWMDLFGDRFYLEIHRIGRSQEELWIHHAVKLSQQYQIPLVATNKVCFINQYDFSAHEARVSINRRITISSKELEGLYSKQQYLRSTQEMVMLFADLPIAIENSVLIAQRCNVEGILGDVQMPDFKIEGDDLAAYFRKVTKQGLEERIQYLNITDDAKIEVYRQRLETEIKVIQEMDYIGYFLIVADFIQWAKKENIPVGPGRGSGAGSLVAYVLNITDIDPIEFDLIFERFLSVERKSMPDFDIDFCTEGRDKVIDYVVNKYGSSQVAQIITFGTLSARAVVRDVVRILGLPHPVGDAISKMIPNQPDITINAAFELSKEFKLAYKTDEEVSEVVDLALQLEGLVRNVGKHAGGIVIAPSNIQDFCPIYVDSDNDKSTVTQFHKDALEDIGLVKFDFLGLKNLTIMNHAVSWINEKKFAPKNSMPFSLEHIDYTDQAVYQIIAQGSVIGVFQLESSGIRRYTMMQKPLTIDDLADMLALYRPGPLGSGMVEKYMKHRQGEKREELEHHDLYPILDSTNGVIIYQEQVMKIAQQLAGFSLGHADVLRQAMGKKNKEKMEKEKVNFIQGAEKNNISVHIANSIFEQMEKFAEYGFNKSHSVAYAVVSYQTAYLKHYYPAAYMAAMMTADSGSQERLHDLKKHCQYLGLTVHIIDINVSEQHFVPINDKEIYWSLAAIKGVGELIAEQITIERQKNGKYKDFFDFSKRVGRYSSNGKVGLSKRVLEMLIFSGAFDQLQPDRNQLLANIERGIEYAQNVLRDESIGQGDLFSGLSSTDTMLPKYLLAQHKTPVLKLLYYEKQMTGIYMHTNPYDIFYQEVQHYQVHSIEKFLHLKKTQNSYDNSRMTYAVLGETERLRINRKIQKGDKNQSKKGKQSYPQINNKSIHQEQQRLISTMEIRIGDGEHHVECVIRDERLQEKMRKKKWFSKQLLLIFSGTLKHDEITNSNSLEVINVMSVNELRSLYLDKIIFTTNKETLHLVKKRIEDLLKDSVSPQQEQEDFDSFDTTVNAQIVLKVQEDIGEVTYDSTKSVPLDDDKMALLFTDEQLTVSTQAKSYAFDKEIGERNFT